MSTENDRMENTSGQGKSARIPPEIERWNWGAFFLNLIWGLGNRTHIALLMLVPGVNLVMPFVLGAKGSVWAWRNRRWESIEHFRAVQRKWALWSPAILIPAIPAFFISFFVAILLFVMIVLKNSEVYGMALADLQSRPEAIAMLGEPVTGGFPMGSLHVSGGGGGTAEISFRAAGPDGSARVYVSAVRSAGEWRIQSLAIVDAGTGRRIEIE